MLQNLKDIIGSPVYIRVGGTTANHATWNETQTEAIVRYYATPGADQPANVTFGPKYLESFKTFPKDTKYTVGLTFNSGPEGEEETVQEATAFYQSLGSDLYAFEVGNEFDVFPVDRNVTTWSIKQYVPEWLARIGAVSNRVFGDKKDQRMFQAGAFVTPGSISSDLTWTAQAAIDLGITSTGKAKTFCTHQYFGAACTPVKPTLTGNVMNRTYMRSWMDYHKTASAYSVSKGLPYVIGETNSIACQGLAGVSDVFGAAVWSVDYALYAASLNVSAIYWHMGIGYRYAAWQAVQNGTTAPGPRPLYYGNMLVATAVGGGEKQVVRMVDTDNLAGYAIYAVANPRMGPRLESIVLVNMEFFNSTASPVAERPSVDFELPSSMGKDDDKLSVYRLTAAGAEVKEGITYAGRTVNLDGNIIGGKVTEKVKNKIINVRASEAVLISMKGH